MKLHLNNLIATLVPFDHLFWHEDTRIGISDMLKLNLVPTNYDVALMQRCEALSYACQ